MMAQQAVFLSMNGIYFPGTADMNFNATMVGMQLKRNQFGKLLISKLLGAGIKKKVSITSIPLEATQFYEWYNFLLENVGEIISLAIRDEPDIINATLSGDISVNYESGHDTDGNPTELKILSFTVEQV